MFRTPEGKVHIMDAYCPHLGANMGLGGVVRGDCLECPFHGWQFDGNSGKCTSVPYSEKGKLFKVEFVAFAGLSAFQNKFHRKNYIHIPGVYA